MNDIHGEEAGVADVKSRGADVDVVAFVRRNTLLLVLPMLLAGGAAALLAWRAPEQYRATAVVRIADSRRALTGGLETVAAEKMLGNATDPVFSQIQVLRSRTLLESVVQREGLRLVRDGFGAVISDVSIAPEALPDTFDIQFAPAAVHMSADGERVSAPYGTPIAMRGVGFTVRSRPAVSVARFVVTDEPLSVEAVLDNMRTRTRDKTDVITVEYESRDPAMAQTVANALVQEFRTASANSAQQDARRRRIFLEEQLVNTEAELTVAQDALGQFRKREQVFSSREKFVAEQASMIGTEERQAELRTQRQMYVSLLARLSSDDPDKLRGLMAAPGAAQNPAIAQLYAQLVQYETAHDTLRTGRFRAAVTDPEVQRLIKLITATETKIADAVRGEIATVDARLAALATKLASSGSRIQELPSSEAEEGRLVQRLTSMQKVFEELTVEYQKARMAEVVEAGQVEILDEAALPYQPVPSYRPLKLAVGLLFGLLFGACITLVRERLNNTVRSVNELEPLLAIPNLGVIPKFATRAPALTGQEVGGDGARAGGEVVAAHEYQSCGSEAYRMVRTNLLFQGALEAVHTLAVTSATPGEGKTTTAANLAVVYAQQGQRVLLIDADLRRPRLHMVFGGPRTPGLSTLLNSGHGTDAGIRPTSVKNLWLMPAGGEITNPAEMVGKPGMRAVLAKLRTHFDLVIVDCPPVLVAPDAALLGRIVDGVVLVVRAGQAPRDAVQQAHQQLARGGARVLGAVLNDPDAQAKRYGGGYYADRYGYYADSAA
jgi:tyrosine-protein kinase Etk/Wzc